MLLISLTSLAVTLLIAFFVIAFSIRMGVVIWFIILAVKGIRNKETSTAWGK